MIPSNTGTARRLVSCGAISALALACASPVSAQVASAASPTAAQLARYDQNKDGVLDAAERAALQADENQAASVIAADKPADGTKSGDPIALTPFEVVTERDRGFLATNAGTATKLGLDLKDLAAPYSVMTGEFLKALNITNIEQAAIWATNGAPVLDGQGADTFNANGGARINNASTMYFARGVIMNAGQQRNYFLNAGTNDTYNVERIDFGRGPNAVLFNVGASNVLGGGISTVGKRARTDRNFTNVRLTTGSWDYYRSELDTNVAPNEKLAVRGNFLWQKRNGWQHGEQDDRTGATLAATWRVTKKSELNIEVRRDKLERSRPPVPFGDNVSGWDGRTVFNGPITDLQLDGLADLTGTTSRLARGATNAGNSTIIAHQGQDEGVWRMGEAYIYDPASGTIMNWLHSGSTRRGDESIWTPIYLNGQRWSRGGNTELLPIGNYGATGGNNAFRGNVFDNGGQAAFTHMPNLPDNRFGPQLANSRLTIPTPRQTMIPGVALFPEKTTGVNLNFTHKFSEQLILDVQADANRVDMDQVAPNSILGSRNLFIDVNRNLPNGQPNPHFLDAYSQSTIERGFRRTDNSGVRAALVYLKDLGKWGNYTFNLSGMLTARDVDWRRYILALPLNADPRDWRTTTVQYRYYQHDSARPFFLPSSLGLFDRTVVPGSGGTDNSYTTSTRTINPRWVIAAIGGQGAEERKERNQSFTFAFAGRWFDNKLVISPGVRVSYQDTYLRLARIQPGWGALPNDPNWDGATMVDDRYWRPDAPADYKSLTYTPRNPTTGAALSPTPLPSLFTARPRILVPGTRDVFVANPYFANDRFRDDYNPPAIEGARTLNSTVGLTYHLFNWAALKLSYGTSFLPADVGRFELTGDDMKAEEGVAYEAAITFSLFQNRLAVTPRYYFNRQENIRTGSSATNSINALMDIRGWNETFSGRGNPFGYSRVAGDDYFARYNDGVELEVAGAITRGWRLSASFGTAQIVDYDRWPLTKAYVRARADQFREVLEAAGGTIDSSRKPMNGSRAVDDAPGLAVPNPAVTDAMIQAVTLVDGGRGDPQLRTNAVNAYNNIWIDYDRVNTQTDTLGLKRLSAKFVSDYTIQEGALRGFRYGVSVFWVDQDRAGARGTDTILNPNFNPNAPVTATNRPWTDDPSVDGNTLLWVDRPFQVDALFGYTRRIRGWGRLDGKEIALQLNIKNLLNKQEIFWQDDGVTLRPPNGDINAPNRVSVPGRIAQYQRPINYEFTATLRF